MVIYVTSIRPYHHDGMSLNPVFGEVFSGIHVIELLWKNLSHASSSLTEKFQARQPVFLLLNYYATDILRDHLLFLKGNEKNQLEMTMYLVIL